MGDESRVTSVLFWKGFGDDDFFLLILIILLKKINHGSMEGKQLCQCCLPVMFQFVGLRYPDCILHQK